jgi:predicted amidohydrolase YtcJ
VDVLLTDADIITMAAGPLDTEPERIADVRVLATVVGGRPAFRAEGSPYGP